MVLSLFLSFSLVCSDDSLGLLKIKVTPWSLSNRIKITSIAFLDDHRLCVKPVV